MESLQQKIDALQNFRNKKHSFIPVNQLNRAVDDLREQIMKLETFDNHYANSDFLIAREEVLALIGERK